MSTQNSTIQEDTPMATTEFRPQEISALMRTVKPAVSGAIDRRTEVRARRGESGRGGLGPVLEEVLWTLARLDLLDPEAARELIREGLSEEQVVAEAQRGLEIDPDLLEDNNALSDEELGKLVRARQALRERPDAI